MRTMTEPKKGPKRAGRPKSPQPKKNVIGLRGSEEWRQWVMALADFRRLKATDLIDQALVEYAERYGFTRPAPKR
jgi:hypothetical protein